MLRVAGRGLDLTELWALSWRETKGSECPNMMRRNIRRLFLREIGRPDLTET